MSLTPAPFRVSCASSSAARFAKRLIAANWPDVLRSAATMVAGAIAPSQLLRKFASYPRQHELAAALREIGRVERTLLLVAVEMRGYLANSPRELTVPVEANQR